MPKLSTILLTTVTVGASALAPIAVAQTIEMETLGDARAFSPGIDVPGGVSADGWIATQPERAVRLMEGVDTEVRHPVVRDMLRRVILAGVAPPRGLDADQADAFARARIRAAQALSTPTEYQRFASRNPAAMEPGLRVDAALARGDLNAACRVSDSIVTGRGESEWVRLRAACHELRGETAAAELARDILRDRGEPVDLDLGTETDPFWNEVAGLDEAALDAYLTVLARDPVTDDLLAGGSPDPFATEALRDPFQADYDLNDARADDSPKGTARLFVLGRMGDAEAVAAFVDRAEAAGLDANRMLTRIPALLDPTQMAAADLPRFARFAVMNRDTAMIRALFEATESETLKQRLALASDALGGGFIARPLGEGLETDLAAGMPTARTDVLIALALGAEMSASAEDALGTVATDGLDARDWIAIDQAIDRGARAEAMLRLAAQIAPDEQVTMDGWTLYRTLRGLSDAGFADVASQLAAYEFLRGLDVS